MNPLLAPPLLLFRALEDLHTLAVNVPRALEAVERLDDRGRQIVALGERAMDMGDRIMAIGERIDARGDAIVELGHHFEKLGDAMTQEAKATQAAAQDVVTTAREILAVTPLLEQAIALGEPLEGAIERIGRIVDRLPGGRQTRTPPE